MSEQAEQQEENIMPYFRPFGARALIEIESVRTSSNIVIPEQYRQSMEKAIGRVVAVGPDCVEVSNGMRVVLAKYAGTEIQIDDGSGEKNYRIMHETDLQGELLIEDPDSIDTEGRWG